ncbi:MAG: hypothetical protein GWP10_13610 [Nitrospiraceae bacterium]|nr:hypothetical protein [Nitrospiraceae bacterium]
MDECEKLAKAVIEHVIPGSVMKFHLEQDHGNYDFDLLYADGKVAAVEVTAARNEHIEGTTAAILDERKGGPFVPRHHCHNDWIVVPTPGARINRIRSQIDSYLAEVETEGRSHFFVYVDFYESPAVRRLLVDLEIEAGDVTKWKTPGICITSPGEATELDPTKVDAAVLREAQKQDNRRKLREAQHPEKHLFVCIDRPLSDPWYAINEGNPSGLPMHLPEEVDIVWAVASTRSAGVYAVWRAERDQPWNVLEPLKVA